MTEPADFEAAESMLPGMAEPDRPESEMVDAARRSIRALQAAGYLDETHAVLCQQMLRLAHAVERGVAQGKASAAALAANALLATYQAMVPETGGGDDDGFNELVAEIRRAATAPRNAT